MAGVAYAIFDTVVGRCGIAWSANGIVCVQLAEAREINTRRRLLRTYPEAREARPPSGVESAIEGIVALLRGQPSDLSDIALDMHGIPPFNRRVYDATRAVPRGETLTFAELAKKLGASGASHAVGQAINRNPFTIIVPCHRVLAAAGATDVICANGGAVTKRRLLSLEGALAKSGPTLFDVLLSVAPPRPAR
jgi:methylated-DNA-[protein]-cysteine S-methyltransferase